MDGWQQYARRSPCPAARRDSRTRRNGSAMSMSQLLVDARIILNVVVAAGTTVITSVERVFDFTVAEDVATAFLKGEPAVTGYERHQRPWGHTDARRTVYFCDDPSASRSTSSSALRVRLAANGFLRGPERAVRPRGQPVPVPAGRAAHPPQVLLPTPRARHRIRRKLQTFARDTWLSWMDSYLDAMRAALDNDPVSACGARPQIFRVATQACNRSCFCDTV